MSYRLRPFARCDRIGVVALDPVRLAEEQLARDRARAKRFPWLGTRKLDRMARSPLAYLRGAAPLFYAALREDPTLGVTGRRELRGEGMLVGDLHLENFGAYRSDDNDVSFDLNDFDEAAVGPFGLDLLRLVTSLILGGRTMGFDGRRALELARGLVEAYVNVAMSDGRVPPPPLAVRALTERVAARTRRELLDARTEVRRGRRRFMRGERYVDLPRTLADRASRAFAGYARGLIALGRADEAALEIDDLAFRIAGTGSLGALRVAVLTRGKGARDRAWIFDMKEETAPAAAELLGASCTGGKRPAARVIAAVEACLGRVPKHAGIAALGASSLLVRRLAPQEDKLDLRRIAPEELEPLARHLGGLVGRAHRRGATSLPRAAWSTGERESLLERATRLAGLHEAAYLAMCRRLS